MFLYSFLPSCAGDVCYDSTGFLAKSKDRLADDLCTLMSSTSLPFLKDLLASELDSSASANTARRRSLPQKFFLQLDELMAQLNSTTPHYIRCVREQLTRFSQNTHHSLLSSQIKPNKIKAPLIYDAPMVLEQLRYSGVFEAVQIRKRGFPFRYPHREFIKRFRCCHPQRAKQWSQPAAGCTELLDLIFQGQSDKDRQAVQIGTTMVLYRADQHKFLELRRNLAVEKTVIFLQSQFRRVYWRRVYKMLKEMNPVLESALQSGVLETLDAAIAQARARDLPSKFPLYSYQRCVARRQLLVDQLQCKAEIRALMQRPLETDEDSMNLLLAAVQRACEDLELSEDAEVISAEKKCRVAKEKRQIRAWLDVGISECDEQKLEWCIQRASVVLADSEDPALEVRLDQARELLARLIQERQLIDQLSAAMSRGGYLTEYDAIDTRELSQVVQSCTDFHFNKASSKGQLRLALHLIAIRHTVEAARPSKSPQLWDEVKRAVMAATDEFPSNPEVQAATNLIALQAAIGDVTNQLSDACRSLSFDSLQMYASQLAKLVMGSPRAAEFPILYVAQFYLQQIEGVRQSLRQATAAMNADALIGSVDAADSIGWQHAEVEHARQLRDHVLGLQTHVHFALMYFDDEMMRNALTRADQLKFNGGQVPELRDWLTNASEEKFAEQQLKVTRQLPSDRADPARVTRTLIRLKDIKFRLRGSLFVFENYPKLRTNEGWANLKFISLSRDELGRGMKRWTRDPIHAPLTEIPDGRQSKTAITMFKNVLGWCGDGKYGAPLILAVELIETGVREAWLRDELYCQLMKQLTANPSLESSARGWQLMLLMLSTFAPPQEIEDYVEYFIRTHAPKPQLAMFLKTLHIAIFSTQPLQRVTDPTHVQSILNAGIPPAAFFDDVRPIVLPPTPHYPKKPRLPVSVLSKGTLSDSWDPNAPPTYAIQSHQHHNPGSYPSDDIPPPPPEATLAPADDWQSAVDSSSGLTYYFSVKRQMTTWDRPHGFSG